MFDNPLLNPSAYPIGIVATFVFLVVIKLLEYPIEVLGSTSFSKVILDFNLQTGFKSIFSFAPSKDSAERIC